MYKRGLIKKVDKGSLAEEAGIEKGDILISVNGCDITDIFDYRFFVANRDITVNILKPNGDEWEIEIEKPEYEDLGLQFEPALIDKEKSCQNKCIFCFIDQLPENMRQTLYFKDDDVRLSYLTGNYVTLTNVKDDELDRIIKYKLSPVNISVHTTDEKLRCKMMNNKNAGIIMHQIDKLVKNNIKINCQIVLCKGINDGVYLKKSIEDLTEYYPGMQSISVVPVGLTGHRDKLFKLSVYNLKEADEIIQIVNRYGKKYLQDKGSRIVFCADEFYILAKRDIPDYDFYEDFPQLENGVGLLALFKKQFADGLKIKYNVEKERTVSIATGISALGFIKNLCKKISSMYDIKINVYGILNKYFGTTVNVTGLLTGKDIIKQLQDKDLGEELLLSESMFKSDKDILLDDMSKSDLEKELNVNVKIVKNHGQEFLKNILGVN